MEYVIIRNDTDELYHHGVKGMKWGVRKSQNKNGTLTTEGKKKYSGASRINKKKVATAVIAGTTLAAASIAYGKNPAVRKAVNTALSKAGHKTVSAVKSGSKKSIELGKKYSKAALNSAKEGIKEGVKEAPKKATKTVVTGATMLAAKRMLDKVVGKEEAAKIFQANNNKKISSFWKVGFDHRDD